jgi:hypothetical protein
MLFWIESSRSRSKVAEPASAKSLSAPISPARSERVESEEAASISASWRWRSPCSPSSFLRMAPSWALSNLAGRTRRAGAFAGADPRAVCLAAGALRVVVFLRGAAIFLRLADVFVPEDFFAVVFVLATARVFLAAEFFTGFLEDVRAGGFEVAVYFVAVFRGVFLARDFLACDFHAAGLRGFFEDVPALLVVFLAGLMGAGR